MRQGITWLVLVACAAVMLGLHPCAALRIHRPWSTRHWCEVIEEPHFPFAYAKIKTQGHETKGVIVDNTQHLGHHCVTRGARTKCFRCENIQCGTALNEMCHYQIQGMNWENLPKNIPTYSNMPWAVGPNVQHRNDWGNAERACVMLSGDDCILDITSNFDHCAVRCIGTGSPGFTPTKHGWTTPADRESVGHPQGNVSTLAGSGEPGWVDGPAHVAKFDNPVSIVVDRLRNVYVADERNHRIRKVTPEGYVTTIAGSGPIGDHGGAYRDGNATGEARLSSPGGIGLYYDPSLGEGQDGLVILVVDTNNHKIRKLWNGTLTTLAGSDRGLADGWGMEARFDTPNGIAVTHQGVAFVADTYNFLIRKITPDGEVTTLAGTTIRSPNEVAGAGCVAPCLDGVPGSQDGPLREATFYYPYDVAIGPNNTVLVADGDRIRRLTDSNMTLSMIQEVESTDRVYTIAGGLMEGERDGIGQEATFNKPRGLFMSEEGRVYVADSVACRVRRISRADQVAVPLTCARRLVDEVRPAGCTMYDQPTDGIDLKNSPVANNVYYNYKEMFLEWNGDKEAEEGLKVQKCVGFPEPDIGITSNHRTLGPYDGTGAIELDQKQDTHDRTTYDFHCPAGCGAEAIARQSVGDASGVYGNETYGDESYICAAAVHAGVLDDRVGGRFTLQVQRGWGRFAGHDAVGHERDLTAAVSNGISSQAMMSTAPAKPRNGWLRTFTLEPYPVQTVEVQTIVGSANAPLQDNCGFLDTQPPQAAMLSRPSDVAIFINASVTDSELLYIADAANNRIRISTAVCSKVCENGGYCISEEKCICAPGWEGDDCSMPRCEPSCQTQHSGGHFVCTAPNVCTCKAGYGGVNCNEPQCVQTCAHGQCVFPDTCQCDSGWFDPNCTTPVCSQTCGNGGNCTAPNTCTCPSLWVGSDCRTVTCEQTCVHGKCIAPNTCMCDIGWSGHDCSKPICHQGFLRQDPYPAYSLSTWREHNYTYYTPCNISEWCDSTNEFDCKQEQRIFTNTQVPPVRDYTGHEHLPDECMMMELRADADTYFRYENELDTLTPYARHTPLTPYRWGPTNESHVWSSPSAVSVPDRQVAHVQWMTVTQGVYICANGGNCSEPDVCICKDGWIGFDCRIPVCKQGYHEPELTHPTYLQQNPGSLIWELQGLYECSARPLTIWEHPTTVLGKFQAYVHDHPNYYSRYMDADYGWPNMHWKTSPLNDDTQEGWRRDGWWETTGEVWHKGRCQNLYNRTCSDQGLWKKLDLRTYQTGMVEDTDGAYRPRISYDIWTVTSEGRWFETDGECVDEVQQGCYNNGTCVAPNTCKCAPGWEGYDCSIPVCKQSTVVIRDAYGINTTLVEGREEQDWDATMEGTDDLIHYRECPNRGNCTLPDTCTCEKGWEGDDCTIPICAQECMNGGTCVLPDVCQCVVYTNAFVDGRDPPRPLFQRDDGESQDTGWTGFDCNTPICVQAPEWIPNDGVGNVVLEITDNAGQSFQAGCPVKSQFVSDNRTRVSTHLCNVVSWYQGVYEESWANDLTGDLESRTSLGRTIRVNFPNYFRDENEDWHRGTTIYGEGLYACFNKGSCIGPDTCFCSDGWSGYDCNTPLCRHRNYFDVVSGCLNDGICADRDKCFCIRAQSLLHQIEVTAPEGETGYAGSDCSIAMCVQGWYDPECILVPPFLTGVASGGEGCYRCPNGGNCTAPDFCTCTEEWQGYDCRTPVCTVEADAETVYNLNTVDPTKVTAFELDPCGMTQLFSYNNALVGQGNCSSPNQCVCLCKQRTWLDDDNEFVELPWLDPLSRELPPGTGTGFGDCLDGFQGNLNPDGSFRTCHMKIKVPNVLERYSVTFIVLGVLTAVFGSAGYLSLRRRLQLRQQLMKAERRRSQRSSEDTQPRQSAFAHQ